MMSPKPALTPTVPPTLPSACNDVKPTPISSKRLEAVKALQCKASTLPGPIYQRVFSGSVGWGHPEILRPQALHTLGYCETPERSTTIMTGLQRLQIFNGQGILISRTYNPRSICDLLTDELPLSFSKLTPKEIYGVKIYLRGVIEQVQQMGVDITSLPSGARPLWLYYAGFIASPINSEVVIDTMMGAGVLDKHGYPINGGSAFEFWRTGMVKHPAAQTPVWREISEHIRDALFTLPPYSQNKSSEAELPPPYPNQPSRR